MECPRCNTPLEDAAAFCGNCGALVKPRLGTEVATVSDLSDATVSTTADRPNNPQPATAHPPHPHNPNNMPATVYVDRDPFGQPQGIQGGQRVQPNSVASQRPQPYTPPAQPPSRPKRGRGKLFFFLFLAIVIIAGGIASTIFFILPNLASSTTRQVTFFDSQGTTPGNTDALKISISGLNNPPDGSQYHAWLINTDNEQILTLGPLKKINTDFILEYTSPKNSLSGTNLLGQGNKIQITQEQGEVSTPSANILLTATFPPLAVTHIRHLLLSFGTTPGKIGLLTGLLSETQKINTQASILQSSLNNGTKTIQCLAQNIVNIIDGTAGADYYPLSATCLQTVTETGDSFGLLGPNAYIATAANHASLAASQPDATDTIRNQAKNVQASTASVKALIEKIKANALKLVADPSATSEVAEIVSLSDRAYRGFDQDGNGKVDPITTEAGAITAYTNGQLMATLTLS